MTVKDLIELLKQYPEGLQVKIKRLYQDERDEAQVYDEVEELTPEDVEREQDAVILS